MNNINLTGRITKDPELKENTNNTKYARFTIAVSRGKVKEGSQAVDFIPCIAWNKTAEILCKYCKKGKLLGVNGRLSAQQYERDGEKKTAYEVICLNLEMLGGNTESKPQEVAPSMDNNGYIDDPSVELPFEI